MAGNTICQVPPNLEDNEATKRFLNQLVQNIDVAFGYRGNNPVTANPTQTAISDISLSDTNLKDVEEKLNEILKALRGSNIISS